MHSPGHVLPRGSVMERANPHLFKGIPKCPECETPAVRFAGSWVCKTCVKFFRSENHEGTPIGELFPNRAARRAAARRR